MRKWLALVTMFVMVLAFAIPGVSASSTQRRYTVVFKSESLPPNAEAKVAAKGGTVIALYPSIGVMEVEGTTALMSLSKDKDIVAVGPSLELTLNLPTAVVPLSEPAGVDLDYAVYYQIYQWDIKQVTNNGASWDLGTGSHNTVVGIIDTGISTTHPDLRANLLGGRNFTPDGPGGTVDPTDFNDRNGHGSHVAGNIAGKGRILGVGPDLGIRAYRVFGATGGSPSSRIIEAIYAAVDDGVDVINMSLGGYRSVSGYTWTDPDTGEVWRGSDVPDMIAYKRAVQYAVKNGVVVVAAAGNEATDISHPPSMTALMNLEYGPYGYNFRGATFETPAGLPGVIGVSATGPAKTLSSYSNYGNSNISLAAPGGDFQRWPAPDYHLDMNLSSYMGTGYVFMAGTSMASPKVAAVAALVIDQAKAKGQSIKPNQVVTRLQQTATDIGKKGNDPLYGHGFVNAYAALGGR